MTALGLSAQGFVHRQSDPSGYEWPADTAVVKKLDKWRDLKFGVLFHWGLYSVPGIVESWSICSEDVDWISRKGNLPYDEYKKWYWSLADSFNPVDFDPTQWADIMDDCGMRYAIFTTKHHDGFCMFDSDSTDFSIAKGPFASDERRDVARHVFDAFRNKGFMVGAYFSKPDWHCPWFWNPEFATPDRRINYKKERHPLWWKRYQDYTAGQIGELLSGLIEPEAEWRLRAVGQWLRRNGEAIYFTVTTPIYNDGPIWFTASKDGSNLYAIFVPDDSGAMPDEISWSGNTPKGVMTLLDGGRRLRYRTDSDGVTRVRLPQGIKPGPLAIKFAVRP